MNGAPFARQLDRAIAVHGMWKVRLRDAIRHGTREFTSQEAARTDQCELGRWLLHDCDAATRADTHHAAVVELHSCFHAAAAAVLRHHEAGDATAALAALDGPFTTASAALVQHLQDWRR